MANNQARRVDEILLSNLTVNLFKRDADNDAHVYSDYLISAVVSIIFLIFLSIMFSTMLYKWVHGPSPIFLIDDLKQNGENCYVASFVTGYRSGQDMTGTVVFSLHGTHGSSADYEVDAEMYDVFEWSSHDFFHVCTPVTLGKLTGISVNLVSKEKFEKWCLNYVTVHDLSDSTFYYFQVNACFTAVSGFSESVVAGKQARTSLLLVHNLITIAKETFLWLCRFTTSHTDKPIDILSNIFQCYLLVSMFMVLLLFYIKIDHGNTVLFSASYTFCLFVSIIISAAFVTFIQLSFRHYSLRSSSVLENFAPVRLNRSFEDNQTQNNAEGSWFESRLEKFTRSVPSVGSEGNISTVTIESDRGNWNINNSHIFSPEKTTAPHEFKRGFKLMNVFKTKNKINCVTYLKDKKPQRANAWKKFKIRKASWKKRRTRTIKNQNQLETAMVGSEVHTSDKSFPNYKRFCVPRVAKGNSKDGNRIEDVVLFTKDIKVSGNWFTNCPQEENLCNHNGSISDNDHPSPPEQLHTLDFSNPPEKMARSLFSSSTSREHPFLRRPVNNSKNYESISTHANQNADTTNVKKMFSVFDMTNGEHKSRRNHFMQGIKDISKNLNRVLIFGSILLMIILFNLIVLLGGDSHVYHEGSNIWVISLFFACLFHIILIEPIKILAMALYWTFKKHQLFQ